MFSYPIVALVAFFLGWYANDKFVTYGGLYAAGKLAAVRLWAWLKSFKGSAP